MCEISIITINFNNKIGLERTIKSVISQSYPLIEYIVIDGGSTDGSAEVIKKYNDKISYWVSELDNGIYHAMNKGIEKANGDYLLFLNSGDTLINHEIINICSNYLEDKKFKLVYGDLNLIYSCKPPEIKIYPHSLNLSYFIYNSLPHPATFIHYTVFQKIGNYDEDLKIIADWKFFLVALFKYNLPYLKINHVISNFSMDGLSTRNPQLIQEEQKKVFNIDFHMIINELLELEYYKKNLESLKRSRLVKTLIKLKLISLSEALENHKFWIKKNG